jgi:ABC-type antimicrobial peptide transport system permease subunit
MASTGLRLVAVGVGLGFAASLGATRVMLGFLLNVSPTDPLGCGGIAVGLAVVAIVACAIPARRAASVDPLVALRSN